MKVLLLFSCLTQLNDDDSGWLQTFGESQFLGDGSCNFGSGGITVEVDLIHAVPVHVGPTQLQTVDGCKEPVTN